MTDERTTGDVPSPTDGNTVFSVAVPSVRVKMFHTLTLGCRIPSFEGPRTEVRTWQLHLEVTVRLPAEIPLELVPSFHFHHLKVSWLPARSGK